MKHSKPTMLVVIFLVFLSVGCVQSQQNQISINNTTYAINTSDTLPYGNTTEFNVTPTTEEQVYIMPTKDTCTQEGGEWKEFINGCADFCYFSRRALEGCKEWVINSCECGQDKCWDWVTGKCEPVV